MFTSYRHRFTQLFSVCMLIGVFCACFLFCSAERSNAATASFYSILSSQGQLNNLQNYDKIATEILGDGNTKNDHLVSLILRGSSLDRELNNNTLSSSLLNLIDISDFLVLRKADNSGHAMLAYDIDRNPNGSISDIRLINSSDLKQKRVTSTISLKKLLNSQAYNVPNASSSLESVMVFRTTNALGDIYGPSGAAIVRSDFRGIPTSKAKQQPSQTERADRVIGQDRAYTRQGLSYEATSTSADDQAASDEPVNTAEDPQSVALARLSSNFNGYDAAHIPPKLSQPKTNRRPAYLIVAILAAAFMSAISLNRYFIRKTHRAIED